MEEKSFFLYKGLKKPLVFKGLKGKYIYYAGAAFAGTMILGIILSKVIGFFIGIALAFGIGGGLMWNVFRLQKTRGLYNKTTNHNEIYIVPIRIRLKQKYEST
ncbi:DUF4133 domain-containing protein [Chryseobacterium sp. ISL-6]|uniref:DUF4133 domain-containing protein n=1 Tax=Chryseobacterium sp. ISL-6 TaxID=2819143 RepID=UPI001BE535E0|nr:DUF4133 domain-containing protein [Chryseobacterium sp. ISL-6]MBT2621310.1 DUF4133 domain-containing protein [Chryseobacterium sp. ISL-6]